MSANNVKLFPQKDCGQRSGTLRVKCGQYALIEGFDMPEGLCVNFFKVFEDKCTCEHYEKPYCIAGGQVGLDSESSCAVIPMPGCYVAYICTTDEYEGDDGCWRVNAEICDQVESLTAVYTAANGVA